MLRQITSTVATVVTFSLVVGAAMLIKAGFMLEMMR
jgi:hypothetical protein